MCTTSPFFNQEIRRIGHVVQGNHVLGEGDAGGVYAEGCGEFEALGDSVPLGEKDKAEGMVVHFEAGHGAFLGGKAFLDVGKICLKM